MEWDGRLKVNSIVWDGLRGQWSAASHGMEYVMECEIDGQEHHIGMWCKVDGQTHRFSYKFNFITNNSLFNIKSRLFDLESRYIDLERGSRSFSRSPSERVTPISYTLPIHT